MIRIILTEQNFKDLTAGKVVKVNEGEENVEIILADIGFYEMSQIIMDNWNKIEK